jgi:uncharacterized metal-binding protein
MKEKVLIVPCSGIGKSLGSVAREGAYIVTEELCPGRTQLMPLALLVLGDKETQTELCSAEAIAIDGCVRACAAKVVEGAGGTVARGLQVLDVCRRHPNLKPSGISELDESGHKLAHALAEEVKELVESLTEEVSHA